MADVSPLEAIEQAMRGHDCPEIVNANIPHLARVALAVAAERIALAIEGAVLDLDQWPGEFYQDAARIAREVAS
jgi:hypothetical protein